MWAEKHRPQRIDQLIGNEDARLALHAWLSKWKPGSKAALLLGPPGTGKTTVVNLLARERGMNLIDLNASDVRTKEKLGNKMSEAMSTVSLFGERSLIFLDEVDGLAGRADYGAVDFIKESVKGSKNPIVMAANDPDSDEVKKLASSCVGIRFKPPPPKEVEMYLREIARREGIGVDSDLLRACVIDAAGDVRQAINLLQSTQNVYPIRADQGRSIAGPQTTVKKEGEEKEREGEERWLQQQQQQRLRQQQHYKDRDTTVSEAFNGFFMASDKGEAARSLRGLSLPPVEKIRGLYKSIVKSELPPETMAKCLEVVARVDLLMGRIMRSGDWRLLRYLDRQLVEDLYPLVSGGKVKYTGQDDLPFPMLLRIWNDSKKVREFSLRYAAKTHTSGRSARSEDIPYVFALCSEKRFREELERSLDLDEAYDKFLQKEAGR